MICETLRSLSDDGVLTAKQIADLLNIDVSSAYRYLSHQTLDFNQLRTLFRQCRNTEVQRRLLSALCQDTPWIIEYIDADADINGDRDINTDDLLDGAIQSVEDASTNLRNVRKAQSLRMSRITPEHADALTTQINQSITNLVVIRRVVATIKAQPRRAKQVNA